MNLINLFHFIVLVILMPIHIQILQWKKLHRSSWECKYYNTLLFVNNICPRISAKMCLAGKVVKNIVKLIYILYNIAIWQQTLFKRWASFLFFLPTMFLWFMRRCIIVWLKHCLMYSWSGLRGNHGLLQHSVGLT